MRRGCAGAPSLLPLAGNSYAPLVSGAELRSACVGAILGRPVNAAVGTFFFFLRAFFFFSGFLFSFIFSFLKIINIFQI
jgi:hypothetical protein